MKSKGTMRKSTNQETESFEMINWKAPDKTDFEKMNYEYSVSEMKREMLLQTHIIKKIMGGQYGKISVK